MAAETNVDCKGRIVIPKEIRKELKLNEGRRVRVSLAGDNSIVVRLVEDPEAFIAFEGVIKKGSPVEAVDPLRLKEMWTGDSR